MTSAKDRYRNDPAFHALVERMRDILRSDIGYTPSELREATLLAAYIEEMENPGPVIHRIDSLRKILATPSAPERPRRPAVCSHPGIADNGSCYTCGATVCP